MKLLFHTVEWCIFLTLLSIICCHISTEQSTLSCLLFFWDQLNQPLQWHKTNEALPRSSSYALDDFSELHPNSFVRFTDKCSEHSWEMIPVGTSVQSREHSSLTADWLRMHISYETSLTLSRICRERLLTCCPCVSNQQPVNHMTKYMRSLFLKPDREIKNKDASKKDWNSNHWFSQTKLIVFFFLILYS